MLPPTTELLSFGEQLANRAREITTQYFRKPIDIKSKTDKTPVTIADQQTELALRELIKNRFPEHAIIGEEHGNTGNSPYQWILDPIDGTRSFISGFPIYCTLIALLDHHRPVLSIIDMPILNERFMATHERTTILNGSPIHCNSKTRLNEAIAYSTDPTMFSGKQIAKQQRLSQSVKQQRYSGDGYCYAMLAAGWIDLVIEADMKPYDYLPLILIVKQAGGVITDWQGKPLSFDSKGEILAASTQELHQAALEKLN